MKKKQLKGFTLVEVLIALAVFSIMALLISTMYVVAAKLSIDASKLNTKTEQQMLAAENGSTDSTIVDIANGSISYKFAKAGNSDSNRNGSISGINVKIVTHKSLEIDGSVSSENDPPDLQYLVKN